MNENKNFTPALGHVELTALYDKVIDWTMPEKIFRHKLVNLLSPQPNEKIMEFGFGTGQNLIYSIRAENRAAYFGLDIDPKVKFIAEQKLQKMQLLNKVQLDLYNGESLPYSNSFFDKVFSCLVFHQLKTADKKAALKEIYRILQPGRQVLICDWGKPSNFFCSLGFYLVQMLDGFETTTDNRKGLLPGFLKEAGFSDVIQTDFVNTKIGTLRYTFGTK